VAQAAVEESRARINMARGALERAEAALVEPAANGADSSACCVPILAPVDGVVLSVDVISARPVAAGARLAAIGDPSRIEIVADLLSADAVRLAPGAPATVERWGGDEPLAAVLRRIEPTARTVVSTLGIEEQRVDAIFDLDTDAGVAARLGDGFAVFLRVVEWQADDVLQVPLGATFRDAEGWAVFVVRDGVAQLRPVTLGRRNARMSEVLAGLAAGERVVTHPSDDLADGARVAERQP
jgi:HlyD family secretion protein